MTHGDRVRIKTRNPYSGMPDQTPFSGKTGTIVGTEFDGRTRMYRVRLDAPIHIPGVGLVEDDLWSGKWLSKVRERRASRANEPWAAEHRILEKIRARRRGGDW